MARPNSPALSAGPCNVTIGLYRRLASAEVGPNWGRKVLPGRLGPVRCSANRAILTLSGVPLELYFL